jgi:EAL domain-containing protein (putative c-di-GMP-specific phosphodiesterase class I)/GGDEF domain-containing protein
MFRRLHVKLTVLYATLFGVTLLLVSAAAYSAISENARRQVRGELTASGAVFDRVWSLRSDQLREGAGLLSRDFGFREAVASRDAATIVSAMENLRSRFGIDVAFIIGVDGQVTALDATPVRPHAAALAAALSEADDPSGVITLGGSPYQVVAAPILSPDLIGWVVFGSKLDAREMSDLERLAAIPLKAAVLRRGGTGWVGGDPREQRVVSRFIDDALAHRSTQAQGLAGAQGAAVALVKPLDPLTGQDKAVLLLRYPLAQALAPYRALLAVIVAAGVAGLALVVLGSWALARRLTRPIAALEEAAHRLQRGEEAQVAVTTDDEIGRLAESFNTMATEIRDRERRITHQALHDAETGLPNRMALEHAADAQGSQGGVFLAAVGVDRFAYVRGAIGYSLAAQVIRMTGNRLAGLEGGARVARLSTEVLGCTLKAETAAEAEAAAARVLAELEQPLHVGGDTIDVALTIGLAALSPQAGGAAEAIEQANIALDQARAARRKIAVFDAAAYGDPSANLSLMSGMLTAIESGQLELFHQPKYDVRGGRVSAVEGLVRWRHPQRGMLRPDLFIPMAEETGHIRTLTDWVLRQAIADQATLLAAGHDVEVSVNISGRLLGDRDFADFAIAEVNRNPGRICFEITETAVIENPDLALEMIDRFAEAGIAISIDDFGTGLSSLAYLKQIRGHELKIDKALIEGVTDSQRDALIVRSTIDLAHSLGLKVTAEGVETHAVYAILAGMGCDNVQGYLVAKPQPLNELLKFLHEDRTQDRRYG